MTTTTHADRRRRCPGWYSLHKDEMRQRQRELRQDPWQRDRMNRQARERRQRPGRKEREAELRALRKARKAA